MGDDLEQADAAYRAECPVARDDLTEVLFRDKEWHRVMAGRDSQNKMALRKLMRVVEALGGVPNIAAAVHEASSGCAGGRRTWTHDMAKTAFQCQQAYLQQVAGGWDCRAHVHGSGMEAERARRRD